MIKKYFTTITISGLLIAILLFWSISSHTYGYYILLRWLTSGLALYFAYFSYQIGYKQATWLFGFIAVFFNPILPVKLDKKTWTFVDIFVGVIFLIGAFVMANKAKTVKKND